MITSESSLPFELEDILLWLCAIPSPTGEEARIGDEIQRYLSCHGVGASQVRRHANSLFVELSRGREGPSIALVGHTDVVRTAHDAPARREGDRLYGPGASDMKSGLALMLGLVARPVETNVNLSLVFYASEEGPYVENELSLVMSQERALQQIDFALVLEPTDNELQLGCGGTLHADVLFEGKSAHSARPWQGKNAIYSAIGFLSRLAEAAPVPRIVDGLEWVTSMSATMAEAGRAPNVIPDLFRLNVNVRFAPDQSPEEVENELRRRVAGEATVEITDCSPPALPFRSHPLISAIERAGVRGVAPKFGWTDVARFAAGGIAAANFGPGTLSQAHQRNEWTSVRMLHEADAVVRRWLSELGPRDCP